METTPNNRSDSPRLSYMVHIHKKEIVASDMLDPFALDNCPTLHRYLQRFKVGQYTCFSLSHKHIADRRILHGNVQPAYRPQCGPKDPWAFTINSTFGASCFGIFKKVNGKFVKFELTEAEKQKILSKITFLNLKQAKQELKKRLQKSAA